MGEAPVAEPGLVRERRSRLRAVMAAASVDALVATSPDNVVYSAGFTVPSHLSNRFRRTACILPVEGDPALVVVTVEHSLADASAPPGLTVHTYHEFTEDPMEVVAGLLRDGRARRVGVELDHLPAADFERLRAALPGVAIVPAGPLFLQARLHKTAAEVATIRALGRQAAAAHSRAFAQTGPGMTERDLARLLADACPGVDYCKPIVGAGERAAHPNAAPTDRPLRPGDVVRVDLIAGRDWFHSDVARTAVVGAPDPEVRAVWRVLTDAYRRVQDRLRPGARTQELYALYLRTLADGGLQPSLEFLGHGLGLTIHEEPYVNAYTDHVLEPGMVLCLEPMYLVPGRMGFHVEDEFLITADGFELLSDGTPNDVLIQVG